jgi:hypothetical protein
MIRGPRARAFFVVAFACAACGDEPKQTAPSSTTSARPSCKESPSSEYEPRCRGGEKDCCALLVDGKFPTDPDAVHAFGVACAGGHVPACTVAREADRPLTWKLDVFSRACASGVKSACRSALFLGVVSEPDKIAEHADRYCKDSKDTELRIGPGEAMTCPKPDAARLSALAPDAMACADGAFDACKALADVDGNTAELLRPIARAAWKDRGLDADTIEQVLDNRVALPALEGVTGKGSATITVSKSKAPTAAAVDAKALAGALNEKKPLLEECIAKTLATPDDKGGKIDLDVLVDARGVVAATVDPELDLKGSEGLAACARAALQDAKLDGVSSAGRAHVTLTLAR